MINELTRVLNRVYKADKPCKKDLVYLLKQDACSSKEIFSFADKVRVQFMGEGILLRGIVEFSNVCNRACLYCGLNYFNKKIKRYRLTQNEILQSVEQIAKKNIKTVVLQSGEDNIKANWLAEVIQDIKANFPMAITLCVGERPYIDYKVWRKAGADRYLLKIETTSQKLYKKLNPKMSFSNRLRCLNDLRKLGYQVGCGNLVGLPGQTINDLASDLLFFAREKFDMIGIGPFIAHPDTKLANMPTGSVDLTLKVLALTRILTKNSHLPATTALGSLDKDYRVSGLCAGANVIMPNFTPVKYKQLYQIYPNKRCVNESQGACVHCMGRIAKESGRTIDYSSGDSLKIAKILK